jgi:hypothetical protein
MHVRKPSAVASALLALLAAGCGTGAASTTEDPQDEVPPATAARFAAEARNHSSIQAEKGCVTETAAERLTVEQARQKEKGTPVDGWLLEVPGDTRIYVCRYEVTVDGRSNTALAVWEAADTAMGGPRPGLHFRGG